MSNNKENDNKIRIVATGDSMTETAGPGMAALAAELSKARPGLDFEIINQGVGGTRVGYGLWRLTHGYEYNGAHCQSLVSFEPDIVLLESFAYNNGSDGPRDGGLAHFRSMHLQMIETIQRHTGASIVCLVTIAPNPARFLETVPNFVHTPIEIRRWMAQDRVEYLEEFERIAGEMNLPTANVYRATLAAARNGTSLDTFIDPQDAIHPSSAGHELTARVIVETLMGHDLIQGSC